MNYDQESRTYEVSPEDRARALYFYFGWDGGTIHQLAQETGLSANTLLHAPIVADAEAAKTGGFSAIRTCSRAWRVDTLAPKFQGVWAFWSHVIVGFWATGPLDPEDAKPTEKRA